MSGWVLIAELVEGMSKNGNEILSGQMSKARLVIVRGQATDDGIPTWRLYCLAGSEQQAEEAQDR